MSYTRMSHVIHVNESCDTHALVMSYTEGVMWHTWMGHVIHMRLSHVLDVNESYDTRE